MSTYPIFHGIKLAENSAFENLVVEQRATDPLGPDEGRIWYNSTDKQFRMSVTDTGGAQQTLSFSTAEELAALLAQLASTATDDSGAKRIGYDGQAGQNGAFSINAVTLADALDAMVTALDAERQATTDLASTAAGAGTNAIGYDGATGASGNFSVAAGSLKAALDAMVAQIDTNAEASSISSDSIQGELDATQAAAGLAGDGTYAPNEGTNYLKSADFTAAAIDPTLRGATEVLDGQLKAVDDDLQAYKGSNDTAVSERLKKSGDTMTGNLNMGANVVSSNATPTQDDHLTNKAYVDSVATGLDVKKSVRVGSLETVDIGAGGLIVVDGIQLVDGDRVLLMGQTDPIYNGIYVAGTAAWTRAADADEDVEVTSGLFTFVEEGTRTGSNGYVLVTSGGVTIGIDPLNFEQFSGAGQVIAGAGISKDGNELFLNFGAGIIETPSDEVGVNAGHGLFTTEDGVVESTTAASRLEVKLDGDTLTKSQTGLKVSDSVVQQITSAQSELDATQTGAGLAGNGAYTANTAANYIGAATSLFEADQQLDAAVKTVADDLSNLNSDNAAARQAIQDELDATQTGAGLAADGAYTSLGAYDAASNPTGGHYIGAATSLFGADQQLDTQLKATSDNLGTEITDREAADTAIRTGAGLLASGALPDVTGTNFVAGAASLFGAVTALDGALDAGLTSVRGNVSSVVSQINASKFTYVSGAPTLVHSVLHNLNSAVVDVTVWIQREDGKFYNDLALVTEETNNELTVTLTAAANIKVSVEAVKDITDPTV